MKYDLAKCEFLRSIMEAKYKYASDLLNLIDDDGVIALYARYNKIFSTLSSMSKEEILNTPDLLDASLDVLEEYLDNYYNKENFEDLTRDEQIQLIVDALDDCDDLYSLFASIS